MKGSAKAQARGKAKERRGKELGGVVGEDMEGRVEVADEGKRGAFEGDVEHSECSLLCREREREREREIWLCFLSCTSSVGRNHPLNLILALFVSLLFPPFFRQLLLV